MARNDLGERQVHFVDEDGKRTTLTLKFTTRAIMALENEMEMEAGEIEMKWRQGSIRVICGMFWAGAMKHHRREVPNVEVAANMLDDVEDMEKFSATLIEVFGAGMPGTNNKKDEVEEDSENGSPKEKKGKKLAAVASGDDST